MICRNIVCSVAVVAALLANSPSVSAAVITNSPAGSPPVVDGADIAQLAIGTNVTAPDPNNAIYMFSDRPAQGQSFTTGSNALGYVFDAFTIQHWGGGGVFSYPSAQPLQVRIAQLSGSAINVIHSETAPGVAFAAPSTDEYVTFTLGTSQLLSPNTTYGFDVGMTNGGWAILGNNSDPLAGGSAYSSGDNGLGTALAEFRDGDRVFHVNLEAVIGTPIPEPSTFVLLTFGVLALFGARRRRTKGTAARAVV